MVHRGNLSQYTNINNSDAEKSSSNTKDYSGSSNNTENTDDSDEKSSAFSSSSSLLPILLNGLELRKIDKKFESNEEEEKGKSTSPSSYTDNNIMNNNNNSNNINNNNKNRNEKIRLRRNSLLISNRNLNKRALLVPSTNMILKSNVESTSGSSSSSNSLSDINTNGEIECNEIVGLVAKLPCSLPLERISDILEKLNIIPKSSDSSSVKSSNSSPDITNGGLASGNKTMCLYCDRTFTCQKLREKHAERVHQATKGRRLSSRTTAATQSAYPGCSFCNVGKISLLLSEDLTDLFSHLIDSHPDKYFACKLCMIRFPSDNTMIAHNQEFHDLNNSQSVTRPTSPLNIEIDFENKILTNIISTDTAIAPPPVTSNDEDDGGGVSNRLRRTSTTRKKRQLLKNEELILSRLGVTQNRSPRTRRGAKLRSAINADQITTNTTRLARSTKSGRQTTNTSPITLDSSTSLTEVLSNSKQSGTSTNSKNSDSLGTTTFDDDFYETVSLNVRKNLSCHLDGKLEGGATSPSPLSPVAAEPPLRSTVVRSPHITDSEIHEATTLSAITAFPTLLTAEQYGSEPTTSKLKRTFTKNSWKWKWDFIKKYKYVNEGGKIVKKIKQQTSGFRDLSKLDMWTQLTMRSKHELICRQEHEEHVNNENLTSQLPVTGKYLLGVGEIAREEKRKLIDQLNTILDSRLLPQINLEQNDQRVIKQEPGLSDDINPEVQVEFQENLLSADEDVFAKMLKLRRKTYAECNSENSVVLSGEWARPRCYVCFGCGSKFETLKVLEEHKSSSHPYVYSTHYEIVGRELIERELYNHFYIPSKALHRHVNYMKHQQIILSSSSMSGDGIESRVICLEDSMDSSASGSCSTITKSEICDTDSSSKLSIKLSGSSTASSIKTSSSSTIAASSSFSSSASKSTSKDSVKCTKCDRECSGTLDLYRHMLDCSSDYAWLLAKKRLRYRYFSGNRSRRRRAAGRNNFNTGRPKLMKRQQPESPETEQSNIEDNSPKKNKECPSTPRSKPSDAESIERMLANLPAKRTCRQIIPNINSKKTRRVRKIIVPPGLKLSNQNKKTSLQIQRRVTRNALLTTTQTRNQLQNNRKINLRKRQVTKLNVGPKKAYEENVTAVKNTAKASSEDVTNISTSTNTAAETTLEDLDTSEPQKNEEEILEELAPVKPIVKKLKQKSKSKKMVRKMGKQFLGKHRMLRRSSALLLNASSSSSSEANSPAITKNIMKQISDINSKNEENIENEILSTSHQHIKRQFKGNRLMRNNLNFTQTTRNFKLRPARLIVKSHLDEPEIEKLIEKESKPTEIIEVIESEGQNKSEAIKEPVDKEEEFKPMEDTPIDVISEQVENKIELIREPTPPVVNPTQSPRELSPVINIQPAVTRSKKKKGRPFKNPKPALTIDEISVEEKIEEVTKVLEVTEMIESESTQTDVPLQELPSTSAEVSTISEFDKSLDETTPKVEKVEEILSNPAIEDASGHAQKLVGAAKRKPKKLNDCIAMLTGKLQQKLGVPFLKNQATSSSNKSTTLSKPESVPESETEWSKEDKIDMLSKPQPRSPTPQAEVVAVQEDELVPLDLSIGKTKPDVDTHQRETIDLRSHKHRAIPLNSLPVSLIKPIAIDLPKPNNSDQSANLKLSEGTLLNLSPVKPIPHSELPFQAALPSSTLIYPARLSSVPRSNPFNTTNHSITIRPFISHSIPSMLSNTTPQNIFSKDNNHTANNKTSISSSYASTSIPAKPSVSVCISSQPPLHNNRTTSVSPPNLSITQIPTGTSISPSNLMHPIGGGGLLLKKPSVTITPSYKQNSCPQPPSSISPPLFLFSDTYNRLNESKSSHESAITIKTFSSLVNNNRTMSEPRRNVMPDKHAINAGLISAMRHKDIDFLKVAELDKIVESINVVKNAEMYETNYKSRRSRKGNNKKLSPMEMVETEMGEDSGDMMGSAPIEPEVIINEDPDDLDIGQISGHNVEVQGVHFKVNEAESLLPISIAGATIEVEKLSTQPVNIALETFKPNPEVVNQSKDSKIVVEAKEMNNPPLTIEQISEPAISEDLSKKLQNTNDEVESKQTEFLPETNEKIEPSMSGRKRSRKSKQINVVKNVNQNHAESVANISIPPEATVGKRSRKSKQITEGSDPKPVPIEPVVTELIEAELETESVINEIVVVKKGKSKRGNSKKNKSKIVESSQVVKESLISPSEIVQVIDVPIADADALENLRHDEINDDTKSQDDSQISMTENENSQTQEDSSVSGKRKEPQTKPRRKRQSELTAIIADQLLESFKEVDKSRIDELKLLHVLSLESSQTEDILLPVVHSTPKRKVAVIKKSDEMKPEKIKANKKSGAKKRSTQVNEQSKELESDTVKEITLESKEPIQTNDQVEEAKEEQQQVSPKRRSARLTTTVQAENVDKPQIMADIPLDIEQQLAAIPIKTVQLSGRIKARRMTIHQTSQIDNELDEGLVVVKKSKEAENIFDKVLSAIDDLPLKPIKSSKSNRKKVKQTVESAAAVEIENLESVSPETSVRRKSTRNQTKQEDCPKLLENESLNTSARVESEEVDIQEVIPQKPDQTSSNESDDDLCLAQFAKNALNKTVESATREDVISSISDTHPIDAEDEAHIAKRSVEFNLDQNNIKVLNPPQFDDFDDNTNTELVDMDLEDETMSVYTSISIDTSITLNPSGIRKKRKRRSILLKSRKPRGPKFDDSNMLEFECELCIKVFRKQESLTKHKMTLTHIAKLSEQEFLNSKNQTSSEQQVISPLRENVSSIPAPVRVEIKKPPSPVTPETPKKLLPIQITNPGIEPISSPEHVDVNYDRYSLISPQKENSRFNLSQEEKLFFECCNMLKGSSDQATSNLTNTGSTTTHIDSILLNNRNSISKTNGNTQTNLLFSNNQRPSPKVDPNQFSDISSDSNSAVFFKNKLNLSVLDNLELNKSNGITESIFSQAENLKSTSILQHQQQKQQIIENPSNSEHSTVAPLPGNSLLINNYSDLLSDMGDSFPSSQDASESEHYNSQAVLERSNLKLVDGGDEIESSKPPNFTTNTIINEKVNSNSLPFHNVVSEACGDETKQNDIRTTFDSPIHSNSSQSSTTSKFITKGALKGYDNFKVSIPTIGIDLQQALVRSSHAGSKLATLADIALSSDVPVTAGLFRDDNIKAADPIILQEPTVEEIHQTNPVEEKLSEPLTIKIDSNVTPAPQKSAAVSPQKISPKIPEVKITTRTQSNRKSNCNKLGFKAKKHLKQQAKRNKAKQQRNKPKPPVQEKRSIDVYEFEDSFDSVDAPIIPLSKVAGGFRAKLLTKEMVELGAIVGLGDTPSPNSKKDKTDLISQINPPNEESQMSSTSFSDRDDFNFGVDSGVSESSDDSESEHESISPGLNKLPDNTNNLQKKCLIMGRIFKNAKKSLPQPVEAVTATDGKNTEKVNKLPKQELDKLFDSLKEVENKLSAEQTHNENSDLSKLFSESQSKNKKSSRKGDTGGGNRKSKKSREMQMLEAEMGMSLEQIKEIIGVGQRKSQRKCATTKPKILAETWSSDEYEDFHTTKDIIALIQETEIKALQRRNRNKNMNKEKSETSEKNQNTSVNSNDGPVSKELAEVDKQVGEKGNEDDPVASVVETPPLNKKSEKKTTIGEGEKVEFPKGGSKIDISLKDKKENISNVHNKKSVKTKNVPQRRKSISANNTAAIKPQRLVYYDSESDFEADWNRSSKRSKIKKRRKTTAFKEINKASDRKSPKTGAVSKAGKQQRETTSDTEVAPPKSIEARVKNIKISADVVGDEKDGKESKIPMSRRKRIASEMLYYWSSSSSDDEFGRVGGSSRRRRNRNRPAEHHHQDDDEDDDADDDELTQNGEHLQQHGWIVGDSHKKLVTLLAHAKGKMTDDCGVKESGNKKKS